MLRFLIKIPNQYLDNNKYKSIYCNNVLTDFKRQLLANVDYNKIKIRYDYLVDNNVLQFNNPNNVIGHRQLIMLLVNQFRISRIITNNNNYSEAICLNSYILIPNSNMSYSNFYKFIEFGNFEMQPYHWVLDTYNKIKQKYNMEE